METTMNYFIHPASKLEKIHQVLEETIRSLQEEDEEFLDSMLSDGNFHTQAEPLMVYGID